MLARTVHAAVWLFMQQHGKVVFACDAFHQIHNQLVVVVGKIGVLEDGGQLKLVGGNLIVARLDGNAQFVALYFQFFHKGSDTWRDRTEIMVFQLLVFGRRVPHECTSCHA